MIAPEGHMSAHVPAGSIPWMTLLTSSMVILDPAGRLLASLKKSAVFISSVFGAMMLRMQFAHARLDSQLVSRHTEEPEQSSQYWPK